MKITNFVQDVYRSLNWYQVFRHRVSINTTNGKSRIEMRLTRSVTKGQDAVILCLSKAEALEMAADLLARVNELGIEEE